jgi:hypothetical protein
MEFRIFAALRDGISSTGALAVFRKSCAFLIRRAHCNGPLPLYRAPNAPIAWPYAPTRRGLIAEATNDPCFGLDVGRGWHPTDFHALDYSALAATTLREAVFARYCRVVGTGVRTDLLDEEGGVSVRLSTLFREHSSTEHAVRVSLTALKSLRSTKQKARRKAVAAGVQQRVVQAVEKSERIKRWYRVAARPAAHAEFTW